MSTIDIQEQVDLIQEVFSYTEQFRNSTFVIKISNQVIDLPEFSQHARDIALLQKAGIRIVIVPGASSRINQMLKRFNLPRDFVDGIRVSHPDAIDIIKTAAFDVTHRIMTALSGHKITAVMGNWVRARSRGVLGGIDFHHTGLVDKIRVEAIMRSLDQGHIPLFPCVGHNESGVPFNLSSDELASTLSLALGAKKLFFITDTPVIDRQNWVIPDSVAQLKNGRIFRITPEDAEEITSLNKNHSSIEMLKYAAKACRSGIDRVHILDGNIGGVLLKEIFSNLGVGTMIYTDIYENIRPMEPSDVPGVLELLKPLANDGILIKRTREDLMRKLEDYWVYSMDGLIHGCAALHAEEGSYAEIAGIAVGAHYAQLGIGSKLLNHLLREAAQRGIRMIFALTTRTADWFLSQGFQEGTVSDLPPKRRKTYNVLRNSKILVKEINPDDVEGYLDKHQ